MLGEFISRGLLMILGYAYPALECFKTVEKNKPNIDELRFWCQYWIIIAILSVVERFGDVFISWVPLYGELKLAFIIYLWYPQTKGSSYVYENLLRPFVTRHETDIEKSLRVLRLKAWDLALYYWENCTELGQSAFFNMAEYVANQSFKLKGSSGASQDNRDRRRRRSPPPPQDEASAFSLLRNRRPSPESPNTNRRWPPPAQPAPSAPPLPAAFPSLFKAEAQPHKSNVVQVELEQAQTEYVHVEEMFTHQQDSSSPKSKLGLGRFKLWRPKST